MKKITFALLIVVLLSGCHSGTFQYHNSNINLKTELNEVIDLMMDEGNYDSNLLVPYDRAWLWIDYSRNNTKVKAVEFLVYRKSRDNEHQYDSTSCSDENGKLLCTETRGFYTYSERPEEVSLVETMDKYANIDVGGIVSELENHYNLGLAESTIVTIHLALPSDIIEEIEESKNVLFYYDGNFHYDSIESPKDMMIEIKVYFFTEESDESYSLYMEIE